MNETENGVKGVGNGGTKEKVVKGNLIEKANQTQDRHSSLKRSFKPCTAD